MKLLKRILVTMVIALSAGSVVAAEQCLNLNVERRDLALLMTTLLHKGYQFKVELPEAIGPIGFDENGRPYRRSNIGDDGKVRTALVRLRFQAATSRRAQDASTAAYRSLSTSENTKLSLVYNGEIYGSSIRGPESCKRYHQIESEL
ncbi:MAG: hypothetical protein COT74_06175 [Bdellovibrionales bacterium CG10_big_fil_rev_8_21_14_0_10_45_34]|nr:MAG: hypothetical protein COT74_06175 [Bdellovibrionales bacterium CG10_big_fil_rev_8_21_14_0_10_45_34]